MSTLYTILLFIHIFSAIIGMGPGFALSYIPKSAKTLFELKYAYAIKNRLHILVMVGGTLLLVTGLAMGVMNTFLFQQGWYWTSLVLFLIALAMGPSVLKPLSKPIKELLATHKGLDIPAEYNFHVKKLNRYENIINLLFIIIITLMVLKPF